MELTPESMGYDRAIVVFSPDGRLFQVEYAREAVKKGTTVIGITYKEGVIFVTKQKASKTVKPSDKLYKVDHKIGIGAAGFVADTRVLVDAARIKAQQHRLVYDESPTVISIAKFLADKIQAYTQYAGVRPYGVSLLIGGVDANGKVIYQTDPSGIILETYARAIGKEEDKINEYLEKEFKENLSLKDALSLAISALKKATKITSSELRVAIIDKDGYKELKADEVKKLGVKI